MRRAVLAVLVVGVLAGPFTSVSSAHPLVCSVMSKLGYEWVRECE